MPTFDWMGKSAVVNHDKDVEFRLLREEESLSVGASGGAENLGGAKNLLVQGDNLAALKALLPQYRARVKCIYIDPPYNTGNENWIYNDAVNSPEIKDWLGKIVGREAEDLSRHDKWLCMMYPRLKLLREFLSDDGAIFVSIDDNEAAHLRLLMDEIFKPQNFLAAIAWEKRYTRSNNAKLFYSLKDTILVYRKSDALSRLSEPRNEKSDSIYANPDDDSRGSWTSSSYVNPATKAKRPNLVYEIVNPNTGENINHPTHAWKYERTQHEQHIMEKRLWWGANGKAKFPRLKVFLSEAENGLVPVDMWRHQETGTTDEGGLELKAIFGQLNFDTPKPTRLIKRILQLATDKDSIVMDSFAGSGTTGHAVLDLNREDNGNRRFILVEIDDAIARRVTAQRLRRVINGYSKQNARASNSNGEQALFQDDVAPANSHDADATTRARNYVEGLGGAFRYLTLGETLFDENRNLNPHITPGELRRICFFHATNEALADDANEDKSTLIGVSSGGVAVYLLQRQDGKNFCTLDRRKLSHLATHDGKRIIYAASERLGKTRLLRENIEFRQLPYALEKFE